MLRCLDQSHPIKDLGSANVKRTFDFNEGSHTSLDLKFKPAYADESDNLDADGTSGLSDDIHSNPGSRRAHSQMGLKLEQATATNTANNEAMDDILSQGESACQMLEPCT